MLQTMNLLDFRDVDESEPTAFATLLDRLVHEIRQELPDPSTATLRAAFVVCAMTDTELAQCLDGTVFQNPQVPPIAATRFATLRDELAQHGIADLRPYYRSSRDHWRPIILPPHDHEDGNHIRASIERIVERLNSDFRSRPGKPVLHPQFFSADFLATDDAWRQRTWDELGQLGCVLVIDAVSMYHPLLMERLTTSEFGSNPRASIVVVSPLGADSVPLHRRLETELGGRFQRAFDRYDAKLDAMCEFGVDSARALNRWLFSVLPQAVSVFNGDSPNPDLRASVREQLGREPSGIGRKIFSGTGR